MSAGYEMLPWVRQGLSTLDMTLDMDKAHVYVTVNVQIASQRAGTTTPDNTPIAKQVALYGPGDVIGFNPAAVARTEPRANVGDFEPNYFAFIEFHGGEADFLWRFTAKPRASAADDKIWPWLTLLVLEREPAPEFTIGASPEAAAAASPGDATRKPKLPPRIAVNGSALPDLNEAWRWAHVQVIKTDVDLPDPKPDLNKIIQTQPKNVIGRLMCARRLKANTRYQAFVVPTFELGRVAGLGKPAAAGVTAADFAWISTADQIELPYYYTWEFGTGVSGDFEYLVRKLEPRKLTGIGLRDVDCGTPGYDVHGVNRGIAGTQSATLSMEGALQSLDTQPTQWGKDAPNDPIPDLQTDLAAVINQPSVDVTTASSAPPLVAPPIYGRWHAAKTSVNLGGNTWIDELNLDPRHRMAAGLGTAVIERDKESLMASAWNQLGAVEEANKLLRQAQLGREGSIQIHQRLTALPVGELLRVAQPVASRIMGPEVAGAPKATIRGSIRNSPIPLAAVSPSFRRIARKRGPLRRRQQIAPKGQFRDLLERLNIGEISAAGPAPKPDGMPGLCDISIKTLACNSMFNWAKESCCGVSSFGARAKLATRHRLFCEENISCELLVESLAEISLKAASLPKAAQDEIATALKALSSRAQVFCEMLTAMDKLPKDPAAHLPIDLVELRAAMIATVDPRKSIADRVWSRIRTSRNIVARSDPLDQIMAAPEFPQAMYQPLAALSQDNIVPGLSSVSQNTIGLLKSNRRFIESYLCACSHKMAGELLWREYPTDQRGTYFRQFWDVAGNIPGIAEEQTVRAAATGELAAGADIDEEVSRRLAERRKDIKFIHQWKTNRLGNNDARPVDAPKAQIVLLVRGDLLKKYKDTLIYAVPGRMVTTGGGRRRVPELPEYNDLLGSLNPADESLRKDPVFSAKLSPDLSVLGFALSENDVRSSANYAGYFFIIEQHVSEARFGMDEFSGAKTPLANWNDLSWSNVFTSVDAMGNGYVNGWTPPAGTTARPSWGVSSATIADITLQRPVRVAIHADKMIPSANSQ